MIRINLLGKTKPKKGKGRRRLFVMPQLTTDGPSPLITGLAILVLATASIYWYHAKLEQKHQQLQADIKEATRQITSMNVVKRRFDIIDQLRAQQAGPVIMLNTVTDTVNSTDGVWLLTLKDNGDNVSLDGIALSPRNVADLMTKLRRTGFFKNVELKETAQRDDRKIETFTFNVICEKAAAPDKPAAPSAKAATQPKA